MKFVSIVGLFIAALALVSAARRRKPHANAHKAKGGKAHKKGGKKGF